MNRIVDKKNRVWIHQYGDMYASESFKIRNEIIPVGRILRHRVDILGLRYI